MPPPANPKPLAGKTAIVTGASSGIGRAIAETLGAAGAHVFLAGRTRAAMEASAKKIAEAGGKAAVVVLDVRDVAAVRELVEQAVRETRPARRDGEQRRRLVPGADRRRRSRGVAHDARDQRARAARRLAGGRARDARLQGRGSHREHLVDRRPAPRLGRLRLDEARRELHLGHAAPRARRRHDPRGERDAGRDRDELRPQFRSEVRRGDRQGGRRRTSRSRRASACRTRSSACSPSG